MKDVLIIDQTDRQTDRQDNCVFSLCPETEYDHAHTRRLFSVFLRKMAALLRFRRVHSKGGEAMKAENGAAGMPLLPGIAELTKEENALLAVFAHYEGQELCAEFLCERGLGKPMTDEGQTAAEIIAFLQKKLRGSGCTIRETETAVADEDAPGTVYRRTEYVFMRGQMPGG